MTVYNLRIEEYHTYFVGSAEWGFSVWAHNADYGTPGSMFNPMVRPKTHLTRSRRSRTPRDQGQLISSFEKSEQIADNFLDDLSGLSLEQIRKLLGGG